MNNTDYTRDGIKLLVEEQDDRLDITHMDLTLGEVWNLVIYLVGGIASITGQEYNQVLEDLKEIEGEK